MAMHMFEILESRTLLTAIPSLGAIYWDGWFVGNPYQSELAPAAYQDRLPFYSTGYGTPKITVVNDSQAVMNQEILDAKKGGLSYFAFDWYSPATFTGADAYNHGLYDYLSSPDKADLNFSLLLQADSIGSKANWRATAAVLVNMFKQPTYEKVLGNRPLVYMLDPSLLTQTFGSNAATLAAMTTLRNASIAAGLGSPYIVGQVGSAQEGVADIKTYGMDAIGSYENSPYENGQIADFPHSELSNADQLFWNQTASTGKNVVPTITTGWDSRPRWPGDVNGDAPGPYFTEATPTDVYNDVTTALNWTTTHQTSDTAQTVLMYAWNETDEGGWLVPTIAAGSARLNAIDRALLNFRPTPQPVAPVSHAVSLVNGSFETPQASPVVRRAEQRVAGQFWLEKF